MATTYTPNLDLPKHAITDPFDITLINEAMDKTDAAVAGKAPAGYGLGETVYNQMIVAHIQTADQLNTATKCGWYACAFGDVGTAFTLYGVSMWNAVLFVSTYIDSRLCQELYSPQHGVKFIRWCYNGTWTEWECVNPPMAFDIEYRTTERHNGKPVFRKAYALGALPNTSRGHYRWYIDRNATIIRSTMYARKRTSEGTITSGDEQYNGNVFFDLANNSIMACATPWTNGSDWYLDIRSSRDLTYLTDTWGEMAYVKE